MAVNWGTVLASVISGVVVSWPGIAVTIWLSHRKLRQHVDTVTRRQTGTIRNLTDSQTAILLGHEQEGPDVVEGG